MTQATGLAPARIGQTEATVAPVSLLPESRKRLVSLDVFRGWTMLWIIGGYAILDGLQHLARSSLLDGIIYQLDHTPWHGLRFLDCIWPSFLLMTGMSLPFAYAKRSQEQTQDQIVRRVLRRALVLFLLGSLRESITFNHPYFFELSSALQPIALAYLASFLLIRRSWITQASVALAILAVYGMILKFVSAPGVPAGSFGCDNNLVLWTDLALLHRVLPEHWGTVLSTIPTLSTAMFGLLIGRLLMSKQSTRFKLGVMTAAGACAVALGFALDPVIPIIMKMWTPSYGLASAGFACLMFTLCYCLVDVLCWQRWAFPLVVIGSNAIAIYMSQSFIPWDNITGIFSSSLSNWLGSFTTLVHGLLTLALEWVVLYWMYQRKIFLTA